jgi:hypothetical protein
MEIKCFGLLMVIGALAGCGKVGDAGSDAAGLTVASDGTVTPRVALAEMVRAPVVLEIGDGYKLRSNKIIPSAGAWLVLNGGMARLCSRNSKDNFYQCNDAVPIGEGSPQEYSFAISTDGKIKGFLSVVPGTLQSPDGSVELPGGSVRFGVAGVLDDGSFSPPTLSAFRLTYVSREIVTKARLLDMQGARVSL